MRPLLLLAALVVIALGVAAVVLGEADDSPGLQLIGVVLVVATVWRLVRGLRPRAGSGPPPADGG